MTFSKLRPLHFRVEPKHSIFTRCLNGGKLLMTSRNIESPMFGTSITISHYVDITSSLHFGSCMGIWKKLLEFWWIMYRCLITLFLWTIYIGLCWEPLELLTLVKHFPYHPRVFEHWFPLSNDFTSAIRLLTFQSIPSLFWHSLSSCPSLCSKYFLWSSSFRNYSIDTGFLGPALQLCDYWQHRVLGIM